MPLNESQLHTDLPSGWMMRPLAQLCRIMSGGTPPKDEVRYWRGNIPWVSGKDMKSPRLSDTIDHVSDAAIGVGTRLAPAGTVFLLVRGMGLAKDLPVAVASRPMAFNQDIKALVPKNPGTGYFIRSAIYQCRAELQARIVPSAHGTMTLNLDDIETFGIPTPSDSLEAEAIGRALELLEDARQKSVKEFSTMQNLKRVAMQTLFTRGLRGDVHKDTEIGQVPQSWEVTKLGLLCERNGGSIQTGPFGSQLHASEYEVDGTPVINPTHLEGNRINRSAVPKVNVSTASRLARHKVEPGDILFGRRGEIGRHGLVSETESGWLCGTGCFVVRVRDPDVDNSFISHLFSNESVVSWLVENATGTIMPNLSNMVLGRLPVVYPQLDEQRDIVSILDAIDRKIQLHKKKRAVLDELFKSLLHKLMTGAIRVADLDLSALRMPTGATAQ